MAPPTQSPRINPKIFVRLLTLSLRWMREMGIAVAAVYFGFLAWLDAGKFKVLIGDDLRCYVAVSHGIKAYNDLMVSYFRFRPVAALFIWGSARLSGGHYDTLLLMGVGLHTLNGFLFWGLLRKQFQMSSAIALSLTFMATFNRFVAYYVDPELVVIEGTATTFYILYIWAIISLLAAPNKSNAALSGAIFLIVLHIHERYMVLAATSILVAILTYRKHNFASLLLGSITLGGLGFNFVVKKLVLGGPILMGTTTQTIAINPRQISAFTFDGLLNLIGINCGPSYLSVLDYAESPVWLRLLSIACAGLSLFILIWCAISLCRRTRSPVASSKILEIHALPLLCLVFLLLVSASITFRQEYRWLYPAFLTFLVLLGFLVQGCAGSPGGAVANSALISLFILSVPREFAIRAHRQNYYARSAYSEVNDLYTVLQHYPDAVRAKKIIISGGEQLDWVFMDELFAQKYKLPLFEFRKAASLSSPTISNTASVEFNDLPEGFMLSTPSRDETRIVGLETAKVLSPEPGILQTPNGKALFTMNRFGSFGWGLASPAVIAVVVPANSKTLAVGYSHALALGDGLNFSIEAHLRSGKITELISIEVPPLRDGAIPEWKNTRVKLPKDCERLQITVSSGTGNSTGDWLFINDFTVE